MNYILLAFIPLALYGAYDYLISKPSRALSTITLMFFLIIINVVIFTLVLFFSGEEVYYGWELIFPFLGSVSGYLGVVFYTKSLKLGNPGINSSIANAYPALTIFIGYFFLKEIISLPQLICFILVVVGIIFSSFHISEIKSLSLSKSKGSFFYAFGATCMWALFVTFLDITVRYFHPIVGSWLVEVFGVLLLIPFAIYYRSIILNESRNVSKNIFILIILLSIISSIAAIAFTYAFSLGSLAIVSAIAACSPAVTTILSRIFDGEKLENIQYIAIGVLILGVVGLSYFSV